MPKIYREEVLVSGTANTRTLQDGVSSQEGNEKIVKSITVTEVTSTLQNDAVIEIWDDNLQLVEMSILHFLDYGSTKNRQWPSVIELDYQLPANHTLKVGHTSGSTASDIRFNIEYVYASEV